MESTKQTRKAGMLLKSAVAKYGVIDVMKPASGEAKESLYEIPCSDGNHSSFWKSVVESKQWRAWREPACKRGWDWDECSECGWISAEHFQAFLKFTIKESIRVSNKKEIEP